MLRDARACAVVRINSGPDIKIGREDRSLSRKITRFGVFLLVSAQDREAAIHGNDTSAWDLGNIVAKKACPTALNRKLRCHFMWYFWTFEVPKNSLKSERSPNNNVTSVTNGRTFLRTNGRTDGNYFCPHSWCQNLITARAQARAIILLIKEYYF